jgi:hypothetical protein
MLTGIIKEREDCYELKSPVLFIFAEKDEVVPLEQVCSISFPSTSLFKWNSLAVNISLCV